MSMFDKFEAEEVEVELELRQERRYSVVFATGNVGQQGEELVTLPRSEIQYPEDAKLFSTVKVTMPGWLATDRGLA